jgi:hypothetical protein
MSSLTNLTTPNISKMTPSNHKDNDQMPKPSSPSISPKNMEYDFLEDLKKTKSNIFLFELMKLPHIQENFIKNLQRTNSNGTKEYILGTKEGTTKYNLSNNDTPSKSQVATNASLTGQRSRSTTPPFLITFKIFNRNIHN